MNERQVQRSLHHPKKAIKQTVKGWNTKLNEKREDLGLHQPPWPYVGAGLVGAAALAAAATIGVGELMVGVAGVYAGYRMFRDGVSPLRALKDAIRLERGEEPDK